MSKTPEKLEFQAEVNQLLSLMIHSLYSHKEVFLRELVSNASDALDKLRFERLTNPELRDESPLEIRLEADRENRTLSLIDDGIGMTAEEMKKNLGTIAHSGTKEFLGRLKAQGTKEVPPELIGQFGVGFYSSFMVADHVTVVSRRAGTETATRWESSGDGSFTLAEDVRPVPGTTITLKLKSPDAENGLDDYLSDTVLQRIVKRYSDFVAYPIKMNVWSDKGTGGTKVLEEKTLNSMKAIWTRPKSEVKDEEYREFYHHIAHDWTDPLEHIVVRIEGTFEAHALLYVPARAPYDLFHPEMKRGVQLFVKRVFIMDECKELMPAYLRFVKGVVDAQDLSLNVSREMLQKDRRIQVIKKQLVKRVLDTFELMKTERRPKYLELWTQFGQVLKEGLASGEDTERILPLVLASSTGSESELTSLDEYVGRMKEGQDAIYYLSGTSLAAMRASPLLESFQAKGIEVLLFADPIDEIWLERTASFKEKAFRAVGRGTVELGTAEERKQAEAERERRETGLKDLLGTIRVAIQDEVKEVRLSSRLTTSAACLVGDEEDLSPQMARLLSQMGQSVPKQKRILELNPNHPLVEKLEAMFGKDRNDPRLSAFARLLFGQAILAEQGQLPDPVAFGKLVVDLMVSSA